MTILTQATLEQLTCDSCGDPSCAGKFWFHGACHPESPTWSYYEGGVIRIECATCKQKIAEIQVAP